MCCRPISGTCPVMRREEIDGLPEVSASQATKLLIGTTSFRHEAFGYRRYAGVPIGDSCFPTGLLSLRSRRMAAYRVFQKN